MDKANAVAAIILIIFVVALTVIAITLPLSDEEYVDVQKFEIHPPVETEVPVWTPQTAPLIAHVEEPLYFQVIIPEVDYEFVDKTTKEDEETQTVDGEESVVEPEIEPESNLVYIGRYCITGYDICPQCCGKTDGITASGTNAMPGRTCAVNGIAFGTELYIDGIGNRVVEDRGNMAAGVIDVLCENHADCYAITGWYDVYEVQRGGSET